MAKFPEADASTRTKGRKSRTSSSGSEENAPQLLIKPFSSREPEELEKSTLDQVVEDNSTHPPAACVRPLHPMNRNKRLEARINSQEGIPRDIHALLLPNTDTESNSEGVLASFVKIRHRMNAFDALHGRSPRKFETPHDEENLGLAFPYLWQMYSRGNSRKGSIAAPYQYDEMSEAQNFQSSGASQIPHDAARDSELSKWELWLKCYTTGHYNLSKPPVPTVWLYDVAFLPAVPTSDEEDRISLCKKYDIVWAHGTHTDKLVELVTAAIERFGAEAGCLSFFDEEAELIQIEGLHERSRVDRRDSIAAHALYSQEVMVILDTHKDWRFEQHPLVLHEPRIRFFAGAPLLSRGGQVMGVLSLLDSRPWSGFLQQWRGELAEFTEKIVEELDCVVEALTDAALRTTPLLDRDSVVNGAYKPRYSNSSGRQFSTGKIEPEFMPSGLQYQPKPPVNARYPINTNMYFSYTGEPTPPSSAESNSNSWFNKPQSYGKNYEQLCEDPIWPERRAFEQEKYAYRCSSPRPYSGSDLTSLRPPPFNSPDVSFEGADSSRLANFNMSDRQFYELSDADCAENVTTSSPTNTSLEAQTAEDLSCQGLSSSQAEAPRGPDNITLEAQGTEGLSTKGLSSSHTEASRSPDNTTLEAQGTEDLSTKGLSSHTEAPSSPDNITLEAQGTEDISSSQTKGPHSAGNTSLEAHTGDLSSLQNEQPHSANISLEAQNTGDLSSSQAEASRQKSMSVIEQNVIAIATRCHFDVVYCVELKVKSSLAPDDVTMGYRMLYGHTPLSELSTGLHVQVLRSGGCMHWQDIQETYERGQYADGYLIRLHPETQYENGSIGLVWGLFRKAKTLESHKQRDSEKEKQLVIAFASKLATIIPPTPNSSRKTSDTGIPPQITIEPQPSGEKSNSEPIGCQPFLANEATEVVLKDEIARSRGVSESSQKSANVEGGSHVSSTGKDSKCQLGQTEDNDSPQHMPPTSRKNSAGITNKFKALTRGALTALGKGGVS